MTDSTGVARGLEDVVAGPSVVTIGNFDGVHRGHHVLLDRTVDAAARRGIRSVAVTFDPHPAAVLRPGRGPAPLQTIGDRTAALRAAGIDLVVVLPFTHELSQRRPDAFVDHVLAGPLDARQVIVGDNFRFGHGATGDLVTLVERGKAHGFVVEGVALVALEGTVLSSSAIRGHLTAGDVAAAATALGRPHLVRGRVVTGDGRGRTIGVPTANVEVAGGVLVPANGVYVGELVDDEHRWPCVTNVGSRPTFDGQGVRVEAHVLDAPAGLDLYDREVAVTFAHRLRGERRFDGPDELVAQIHADIDEARRRSAASSD